MAMAEADAEVQVLSRRIDTDYPARAGEWQAAGQVWNMSTFPLSRARFFPGYRNRIVGILTVLIAVAGGVLLIACANIASLMLIRATERQKEMALQLALGAKTLRVARLLLAESLTIAFAGGAAGLLVAAVCTRALVNFPRLSVIQLTSLDLRLDVRVFAFAILITTLSGIAFGLAPLRQAVRTDLISSLKTGAAASTRRGAGLALRNTLLIGQIALTLVLLAGSGLFIRTFQNAADSDPFLQAGNLLLLGIDTDIQMMDPDRSTSFFNELLDRTQALPGVRSAGLAWELPLNGIRSETEITTPLKTTVDFNIVSPEYFKTVGSRVVQGRDFSRADRQSAPGVGVVNEEMAKQLWNGDAVGRQITRRNKPVTIVGIVRDRSRRNYRRPVQPCLYLPFAEEYRGALNLVIRTQDDPLSVLPAIRDAVASVSSAAVIGHPQTLSTYSNVVLGQERLAAWCLSAFAGLALVLSVVGLYGSTAFSVSQRTPEIGVRMALGARRGQVSRMVVTGAARIAGAGWWPGSSCPSF
jgi:predicted permease